MGCGAPFRGRSRRQRSAHGSAGALRTCGGYGGPFRGPPCNLTELDTSELLKELRIDRDGRTPRTRRRWLGVAAVALVIAGVGGWLAFTRLAPTSVRTATAQTVAADTPGSVLDASGYVTARRQATVSAKITGKVTEVRIEEGMRVEEGDILARLEDTEAKAQLALARAQLAVASSQEGEIRALLQQAENDYTRAQ